MSAYRIPTQVHVGFKRIIELSQDEIKTLSSVLETAQVGSWVNAIVESNVGRIPSLNEEELIEVIRSLFSMVNIFVGSNDPVEKFANEFAESYKEFYNATPEEAFLLKENLIELLPKFSHIRLTIKARDLLFENQNNYSSARIISDIRIVFDDESTLQKKEQCALVLHQLKVNYNSGSESQYFHVALDLNDLHKLKEIINRAIEKDGLIRGKNHELDFIDLKN